jgi:hypothetical protein
MRLAVIEACGAAEVAAAVAIERALGEQYGRPADFVRAVARGARGIRRAHETIIQLDVPCGVEQSTVEDSPSRATVLFMLAAQLKMRLQVALW